MGLLGSDQALPWQLELLERLLKERWACTRAATADLAESLAAAVGPLGLLPPLPPPTAAVFARSAIKGGGAVCLRVQRGWVGVALVARA